VGWVVGVGWDGWWGWGGMSGGRGGGLIIGGTSP
jgi:hypothetical protein